MRLLDTMKNTRENLRDEHPNYKHFESWASAVKLCKDHAYATSVQLVARYTDLFPGRTKRLLAELIIIARTWTEVQNQSEAMKKLCDEKPPDGVRPL